MQDNSKLKWIDIGVNLTNKRFNKDRDDVIHRAIKVGVEKQIITGTNVDESMQAFALTKGYPNVLYSTAGCHPHEAKDFKTTDLDKLQNLLKRTSVVAVGECGLDFNRNFSPKADQLGVFEQQLELAVDCQKPVFLHERDAFEEQYKLLKSFSKKLKGGVVHCFTGDAKHMQAYLDLGFYIGITGWICDERRGKDLFNQVHLIPADKLLLETDAPYLLPRDLKPKPKSSRNLPEFLPHIAKRIAQARNVDLEELALHCYDNTKRLFNI